MIELILDMTVCNSLGRSSVVLGVVTQMLCYLSIS